MCPPSRMTAPPRFQTMITPCPSTQTSVPTTVILTIYSWVNTNVTATVGSRGFKTYLVSTTWLSWARSHRALSLLFTSPPTTIRGPRISGIVSMPGRRLASSTAGRVEIVFTVRHVFTQHRDKVSLVVNYISSSRYCQVKTEEEAYESFITALKDGGVTITHRMRVRA